ncbi:PTS fructose transporter subunit IIABC [Spiroplasma turonicum]|uniref:PTS system fructose-specific IIABC component n=1 Tax=Spiroplasma turonicum TaxID=216946 RepID=A0A0K1P740_9MOLU|nr:fructose-specific PTS transporter subunit EIIC [Spiroplasma turonicum]AKU80100.1 PTS system fructose-specific IIABC component [Spiroplasma turonicum]ALX71100.1 PTS system, fructose-specific IIB component [Spiroplasma turonicum]
MRISEKNLLVFINKDFSSKEDILKFISEKSSEANFIKDADYVYKKFIERENLSSTGLQDGFAIPHIVVEGLIEPYIICIKNNRGVFWDSLDGKNTSFIISIILPKNDKSEEKDIISEITKKLYNKSFKEAIKKSQLTSQIEELLFLKHKYENNYVNIIPNQKENLKIVAVTSCLVGISHTYLAEQKLLNTLTKDGYQIRVETQGSRGVGTKLTDEEIKDADLVIIASDVPIDKTRFIGKKLYETKVINAIRNPSKLLNDAKLNATSYFEDLDFVLTCNDNLKQNSLLKHIVSGINYMIPILIIGGICLATSNGLSKAIWGFEAGPPISERPYNILSIIERIGVAAFTLMVPILAAFIASSIGGKVAIAPSVVGGFIGNDASNFIQLPGLPIVSTPMGFIGSIISGICVGYFSRWVNTWNLPRSLKTLMPIFFIPIVGGIGISIIFIYIIGAPVGLLMQGFSEFINYIFTNKTNSLSITILAGALIGAMASLDVGGPINKIAFITCILLVEVGIYEPMGCYAAAVPVAPISMGLSTIFMKRFFTTEERTIGISSILIGIIGVSEGAIPLVLKDPKKTVLCNVIGGSTSSALACLFSIKNNAGHGGPLVAILGSVPYGQQTFLFLFSTLVGVSITTLIYCFMLLYTNGRVGSLKETYVIYRKSQINLYKYKFKCIKCSLKYLKHNESFEKRKDLKNKLVNIKLECKAKLRVSKKVFNELNKDYIKSNSAQKKAIKNNFLKLRSIKKDKINKLRIKHSKINIENVNKSDLPSNFKQEKNNINNEYKSKYKEAQIKNYKKYVDKFKEVMHIY